MHNNVQQFIATLKYLHGYTTKPGLSKAVFN